MDPRQADMFGPPRPTYIPENAQEETQGTLDLQTQPCQHPRYQQPPQWLIVCPDCGYGGLLRGATI